MVKADLKADLRVDLRAEPKPEPRPPEPVTNMGGLSLHRLTRRLLLTWHYYTSGPLIGVRLRLLTVEYPLRWYQQWQSILTLSGLLAVLLVPYFSSPVRFATLLLLLALSLRSLSSASWSLLEYRAYFAVAALAILFSTAVERTPLAWLLLPLWFAQSQIRISLYSNALSFWKQASEENYEPAILSNYIYQMQRQDNFGNIDRLYADMIQNHVPESRTLLINLAAAKFGGKEMWDGALGIRLKEARQILENVVERWPDHGDGWRNLGAVVYYMQDIPEAIRLFSRAVELDPKDGLAWFGLGQCRMDLDPGSAVGCLKTAFGLNPHVMHIRVKLMESLLAAGQLDEFQAHDRYLKSKSTLYVTKQMLPERIGKGDT